MVSSDHLDHPIQTSLRKYRDVRRELPVRHLPSFSVTSETVHLCAGCPMGFAKSYRGNRHPRERVSNLIVFYLHRFLRHPFPDSLLSVRCPTVYLSVFQYGRDYPSVLRFCMTIGFRSCTNMEKVKIFEHNSGCFANGANADFGDILKTFLPYLLSH